MASGGLFDSIWAPGNEARRYNRQASTGTPVPKHRAQRDPRNLSAAAMPLNPNTVINAISPWPNERVQHNIINPVPVASTSRNSGGANTLELSCLDSNTPRVPLNIHGKEYNTGIERADLPSQPQAGHLNAQTENLREHSSVAAQNPSTSSSTPQTLHQSRASDASPIWHISPQSKTNHSLAPHTSVVGIQGQRTLNDDSIQPGKILEDSRLQPDPYIFGRDPLIPSLEKHPEKDSAYALGLSGKSHRVQGHTTLKATLQHVPALTTKTLPNLSAASPKTFTPAPLDNTDAFLAFMRNKMKESPAKCKRYVALTSALESEGREANVSMSHKPQASPTIQTPFKENIPLSTTPYNTACAPTGLRAVMNSNTTIDSASHAGNRHSLHQNTKSPVLQTIPNATTFMAATSNLARDKAFPADVKVTRDETQHMVIHSMQLQFNEFQLQQAKDIHKALLSEIMVKAPVIPNAPKLTEESLMQNGGWPACVHSEDSFCEKISNTGVETKKENVRASQGRDAAEELQNRSSWYPHTPDWEQKNWALDASYIPAYIQQDWLPFITDGKGHPVDMNTDGFKLGKLPVNDKVLGKEVIQPDCIPDIENSKNEEKRLRQTAEMDCLIFTKKRTKRYKDVALQAAEDKARCNEIEAREPVPHPYAPAIPIYLRPVTFSDTSRIRAIYNYYIKNSIIPEDQSEIQDIDIEEVLKACKNEHLPFVVAVKGNAPVLQPQSLIKSSKPLLPKFEIIVGFGFAQTYAYGFRGKRDGRSRATVELQFYVHHEYTRKGVGRSLLDRLIQSLSHSYAGKDGYNWINPIKDPIYDCTRLWHQLVIQLPVEVKDDKNLPWITEFFEKYWLDQEARLRRFARTSIHGTDARFVDVIVFAKTASVEMEYPPFL